MTTGSSAVSPSSSSAQSAAPAAAASGSAGGVAGVTTVTAATGVKTMAELQQKAPDLYKVITQAIGQQMCVDSGNFNDHMNQIEKEEEQAAQS